KLNFVLSRQIYTEYQNRYKEALYLIEKYKTYMPLQRNLKTVELILALSIFHKRVISNLDSVVKFHGTVNQISEANTIKMGSYNLTVEERNKLLGITINFNKLIKQFSIPISSLEYNETKELLRNIISLKNNSYYAGNLED